MDQASLPRSIGGLSTALRALLWVSVALAALSLVDAIAGLWWLQGKAANRLDFWYDQPVAWAVFSGGVALLVLVIFIATVVVWLVWQHRATRNVLSWGGVPRRGSGWAVGAWFVPIINFWWPPQNLHDVLRLSAPGLERGARPERQPDESIIGWWWALWLLSGVATQVAGSRFLEAQTNAEWASAYTADLVAQPLTGISAVLAASLISKVAQRQGERLAMPAPPPSSSNPGLNL